MLKLEDITKDAQVLGLESDKIVRIVSAEPVGDGATNVFYVDPDGCTSSEHMAPLEPFSKRHFSARTFSSLAC